MILTSFSDETGYIPEASYGYAVVCYMIGLVIAVIYSYLYRNCSGYELNEKEIICKKGIIFKKKSIVEFSKIHAINIKQNLVQRILGISALMVDSGSTNTAHTAEIAIYDDVHIIQKLYDKLQNRDVVETEKVVNNNLYSFNSNRKVIYTLLNSIVALFILVFGTIFVALVLYFLEPMVDDQKITLAECILYPLFIFGTIFVITAFANLCKAFISYYGFEIKEVNNAININYGLFVKIHNSFNIDRVKAVKVTQGIIQRIFGFVTMRLEVVGYSEIDGNNGQIIGIFIPLCKVNEVEHYLNKILPLYVPIKKELSAKSYKALILWDLFFAYVSLFIIILELVIFSVCFNEWVILLIGGTITFIGYFIFTIIYFIDSILAYKNQGISINDNKITVYNGGFIKNTTIILKENLIAIEDVTTKRRKVKGIYSYKIHFHTNATSNVVYVKVLDESIKNRLIALLKF